MEVSMLRDFIRRNHVFLALFFFSWNVWGQVNTATLVGTVRDASGAVVTGAAVTVKSEETAQERSATTDVTGNYTIPNLQVGHYVVSASLAGFKTSTTRNLELQVAQRATVNFVLEVGDSTQSITLVEQAPLMNTESAVVSQVVDTKAVESMPLNGRAFWQLTQLTPGASYNP